MTNCITPNIPSQKNAGIFRVWMALDLRCTLLTASTNRNHAGLSEGKKGMKQVSCQPIAT